VNLRLTSGSAEITRTVGEALGRAATGPLAFLLTGDYGTGKTTFVQGLARGLEIVGPVRSPSYNILKRYQGRLVLVHADLYRTRSAPEVEELGLHDIADAAGILAVEWPGRFLPPLAEMPCIAVSFSFPADLPLAGHRFGGAAVPGRQPSAGAESRPTGTAARATEEADSRRNLEFQWQDDCPATIKAVLHALAAR
jgi:tRNA threonylcarbamoyladenosine biosynthesis protein TsaE